MNEIPETFIRGIPQTSDVNHDETYVGSHVFYFGKKTNAPVRDDNCHEESINWEDTDKVRGLTLSQTNEKGLMFKGGIAILPSSVIEEIQKMPNIARKFDSERRVVPGNDHHGNLLLSKEVDEKKMKQIASAIALRVTETYPQS